jgi:hypothetical protein
MSRLHDMKLGIVTVVKKKLDKTLVSSYSVLGKQLSKLNKEDPEKVRGFLTDLANDTALPEPARLQFQKMLDGFNAGKPVEDVAKENLNTITEMAISESTSRQKV